MFSDAAHVVANKELIRWVYSDAVPMYLDQGTGKVSVPLEVAEAQYGRQLARRRGEEPPGACLTCGRRPTSYSPGQDEWLGG